jgi:hypothetical protein
MNKTELINAIGFGFLCLFGLGMFYVFWSIFHGVSVENLRPYILGSIISLIIGAPLYYSAKRKRNFL